MMIQFDRHVFFVFFRAIRSCSELSRPLRSGRLMWSILMI